MFVDRIINNMSLDYSDKVLSFLINLPVGTDIELKTMVAPENMDKFIECGKMLIDSPILEGSGQYLEFSSDYLRVRKMQV